MKRLLLALIVLVGLCQPTAAQSPVEMMIYSLMSALKNTSKEEVAQIRDKVAECQTTTKAITDLAATLIAGPIAERSVGQPQMEMMAMIASYSQQRTTFLIVVTATNTLLVKKFNEPPEQVQQVMTAWYNEYYGRMMGKYVASDNESAFIAAGSKKLESCRSMLTEVIANIGTTPG